MSATPLSLSEILRYDEAAVKFLFEQYYIPLVLFAKNFVPDIDECKDIVQEIFLDMTEKKEKFTTVNNMKAWLYSVTRNRCLKHIKHEEVKERYVREMQNLGDDIFYLDCILEEEVYLQLKKAIDALPPQCRKVFLLVLDNKSNQEIANALSISIETVKSYKKTGKRLLYERLKGIVPGVVLSVLLQL